MFILTLPCIAVPIYQLLSTKGRSQTFQNEGAARGAGRNSNWQLSIDPCPKCHVMGGSRGAELLTEGAQAPMPVSTTSHRSITGFQVKMNLTNFMQQCNTLTLQFLCRRVHCAATQHNRGVLWMDLNAPISLFWANLSQILSFSTWVT